MLIYERNVHRKNQTSIISSGREKHGHFNFWVGVLPIKGYQDDTYINKTKSKFTDIQTNLNYRVAALQVMKMYKNILL